MLHQGQRGGIHLCGGKIKRNGFKFVTKTKKNNRR